MTKPAASRPVSASAFAVETLESRLLLSADPLGVVYASGPGSTSAQALADLGHADLLPDSPAPSGLLSELIDSPRLNLTSAALRDLAAQNPETTTFGTPDLLTQVIVGDTSGQTVQLPGQTATILADYVEINAPLVAQNLVIDGDGSTVKLSSSVTSDTNIINDAVEVSGNFAQNLVRTITSNAGVLTINGSLNGDNHLGAVLPVNANNGPDDVVLNATGAIFIRDAVGGIANNGLQHLSINVATTGGEVGNVTFNDTVNLNGNLYIKKGQAVTFSRNVVIQGDLVIEDATDVRFDGTLTVTGSVRIIKAGNVTFGGNVSVGGDFTVGRPDNLGSVGGVTFAVSARLDFAGHGGIYTSGSIAFGNNVGENTVRRPDSLTLAAQGTIAFALGASLLLDSTTPFVVSRATDVTFGGDVRSGNVTIGQTGLVTGNIAFSGASVIVESFTVTTSGALGRITIANNFQIGGGDATLTANEINFGVSATLSSTGAYASTLTLKPFDVARAIAVGPSATGAPGNINNRLDFSADDLKAIQAGFAAVVIGDLQAGTGDVFIGSVGSIHASYQLLNRTIIAGGTVTVTQNLDVATAVDYLRLVARIGNVTVNGAINRGASSGADLADTSFAERNPWVRLEAAADIVVNRPVYAGTRLSLTAGTDGSGSIQVNSTGTASGTLQVINPTGMRRVELVAGESSGNIVLTDGVGETTLRAPGTGSSIVLRANGGSITQTDGLLVADTLSVWARDGVSLRTEVNQIASQTINGEILPGGTGAVVTANMTGSLSTLLITNGGTGYSSAPTVSFSGGGGSGAAATAVVVGGFVTGLVITNPGSGYTSAPTVTLSGGSGTGATALAVVSPGQVANLSITTPGSGFGAVPTLTIVGDGRTVATGTATVRGGVGGLLVTSAGSSYTNLTLTPVGSASVTGTFNVAPGQLTAVNLANPGTNYSSAPTVAITGNGTGAAVQTTLDGFLFSVTRTPGSGYTYTPSVVVSGGAPDRVVNGLQVVGGGSVNIVNSGAITVANATVTPNTASTRGAFSLTTLAGDIALGYVNTSTGAITLTAAGAITDADTGSDALPNLVTTGLVTLTAATGIGGLGGADIDATIGSLQATNSTSGDIVLQHAGLSGFTVAGTGVRTLGGDGDINLQSSALNSQTGTLTVNAPVSAHGSGYVRLEAVGVLSDVLLNHADADLTSATGPVTVIAERHLTTVAGTRVTTSGGAVFLDATTGALTMADDSLVSSSGGAIRARAQNDVTLGGLDAAAGTVSVLSAAGAILDAGDTHRDIIAASVRLNAFTSVGVAANALEISAGTLSAAAAAPGITLVESDDVTIGSVTASTSRVNLDGSTTAVPDTAQSDLATTANGSVSLTSTAGTITLTDGDNDNHAVSAQGTGRVFLSAGVSLVAQSDILSGTGAISVHAADSLSFTAGSDVTTVGGSIDLLATTGSITQADTAVASTSGGSIRAHAGLDVTVASFNAAAGNLSVEAGRSILDAGDTHRDLIAASARLAAGTAAGAASDALETTFAILAASAGAGGVNLSELDALDIDAVVVSVNRVSANHTTAPLATAALADVVTADGGPVRIVTGGNLTLNQGDADPESVHAAGGGSVTLLVTGDILMQDGAIVRTDTGSATLTASGSIQLSIVASTSGDLALTATAGNISDVLTGEAPNLLTSGLAALDAATGIGATGTADIDTALGSVTALNRTSGNIVLEEADAVTLATAGLVNQSAGSHVILSTLAGTITVQGPVTATGSGRIRLSAAGVSSDIVGSTAISTGSGGHVTLLAARSIQLDAGASVATLGTGTLDLEATAGSITFADAVAATTAGGNIRLLAQIDATVTGLSAASGSISVHAVTGSILDGGETLPDLVGASARLVAAIGVGSTGALETNVGTIAATATTGGIALAETNDLTVGTVAAVSVNRVALDGSVSAAADSAATSDFQATTGDITLTAGGILTLTDGVDADSRAAHTTTGDISLTATADVRFQSSVVSDSGDLTVASTTGALVDQTADENALLVTTALATVNAATGIGVAGAGDIDTTVVNLRGSLGLSGGVFIEETDTLVVHPDGLVTLAGNAPLSLVVTTGPLTIDGPVTTHGSGNIHVNTKAGPATVNAPVSSTSGHVTFLASGLITLNANLGSGAAGTLNVVSSAGSIVQADSSLVSTGSGDIRLRAAGSITVAALSTTGRAALTAISGSIIDGGDSRVDVVASSLRIEAGVAVGTAANHLDTTIATLSAWANGGGIFLTESDGFTATDTTAVINLVLADTTATGTVTDNLQSDVVTTAANGSIVLVSTTGDIILDNGTSNPEGDAVRAHGSGNVLIDALAGSLTANADVRSATGHLTLKAAQNLSLTANVDVRTATPGTVSLDAETGALTMHGTANAVATGSSARLRAQGDITVGNVTATHVSIDSDAGSIINAALSTKNVTATNLRLQAQNSIGVPTRHLTTNIDVVTSLAATGSTYVTEDNAATVDTVSVTVTDFNRDATTTTVTDAAQSDLTTGLNGNIVLVATLGDITLNDGLVNDTAVSANGTGSILIDALAGSITGNADILSGTGHITLKADDNITLTEDVDVATAASGTVSLDAETGFLLMHGTADILAASSSARLRAQGDITVGNVTATHVSIDSDAGSILNAALSTKNVTATNLRLQAQNNIGVPTRHLTTNIDVVTSLAFTGSTYVTEDNAATVDTVSVTVTDFNRNATTTDVTDAAQSDLTTGQNGNIVLVATLGDITLNDGLVNDTAVSAHGTGSILVDALAGSITGNADLLSGTGHITLKADDNITLTEDVDVATATPGTVSLDAETGFLLMHGTADILAASSSARLRAQGDITVGNVTSTNVSIDSDAGSILNAALSTKNVTATNLRLQAQNSIGVPTRHLTTNIDVVTSLAATGSTYVTEDNAATVDTVSVTVTDFNRDATTTTVTDAAQSDLTTGLNGNIVLVATLGDITLNDGLVNDTAVSAHGTGSILIDALAGSITGNADILSGTGHITLKADDNITLTEDVDVATAAPGTVSLDAETGFLLMHGTADILAANSSARLRAQGDITVGNVTATNVSIDSDAGSIINAALSTKNVTATNLRLQAQNSIGVPTRHLTTNIDVITSLAFTGSTYVTEDNAATVDTVSVTVTDFNANATTTTVTDAAQSDLTTGLNGNIVLVATLGDITLNDGLVNDTAVSANGSGSILIDALAGSITGNADILSGTGHITLKADDNITFTEDVDVATAASGTVSLDAETGFLLMHGTADILAANSSARLRAQGDITVGNVTATHVSIDSDAGSILNAALSTKNVTATNLRLQAQASIGAPNRHLTTNIDNLSAFAATGSIFATEDNGATVQNVAVTVTDFNSDATTTGVTDAAQSDLTTGLNGNIVLVVTAGDLSLTDGTAPAGGNSVLAHGTGNVLLQTVAGSITATADIRSGTGHITLKAHQSITLAANTDVVTGAAGTQDLVATTGSLVMAPTATLQTVNGDIRITVGDDVLDQVVIGDITASNANVSIVTTGSVLDADSAALGDDTDADVTANGLRIDAGKGIGLLSGNSLASPVNAIDTTVTTLSAIARGSDGINILESTALVINDVVSLTDGTKSVSVQAVNANASTTTTTEETQSDLVTTEANGANGSIVVRTTNGDITFNEGTATLDLISSAALVAHGTGNILVQAIAAGASITANSEADLKTTTGHVTLLAAHNITLNGRVDVVTAGIGTIDLLAGTGSITMAHTATLQSVNGDIRLTAGDDVLDQVVIGDITATNANVSIETTGSVLDADTSGVFDDADVTARGLRIVAGKGVGLLAGNSLAAPVNALETTVDTLSVHARGSDGMNIVETDAVAINDVVSPTDATKSVSVQTVNVNATTTTNTEVTQSDLVTSDANGANGSIVLRTLGGTITLSEGTADADLNGDAAVVAHGSGNILLQAAGAGTDIVANANADLHSTTGHLTLKAARTINLAASVDVTTGAAGTQDLVASTGSLVMAPNATLQTVNGDIRITVGDDVLDQVVIGNITASNANVSVVTTGSVLDADTAADSDIDVTARGLRIVAGKGVGLLAGNSLAAPVNALETTVDTLSVHARGSDGMNIVETDAVAINDVISPLDATKSATVQTVQADATTSTTTEVTQSDLVTSDANGANGSIVLRTLGGTITLSEGTADADLNTDAAVVAHGSGNILLQAAGAGTDIVANANADLHSTTGHLTLKAARTINLAASVDVTTGAAGTQDLVASTGSLVMAPNATLQTVNGDIRITVGDDVLDQVVIGDITASNANVSVVTTGSVLDADTDADSDIDVTARGLRIVAGKGVGLLAGNSLAAPVNALETTVDTLSVHARGSDGMNIVETDAVAINDVISPLDATKSATVQTVQADATTSTTTEVTQSDLVTSDANGANGSIVLRTLGGTITLSEGTADADLNTDAAVVAHGSGNILLQATGAGTDIVANTNADLHSTTGHLTLKAARDITLGASVDVTTAAAGTLSLDAQTGALTMHGTSTAVATGSSARLRAQGDITVGNVTATNVSIDSDAGSILNAAASTKNVTATNLRLQAQAGIGAPTRHLTTNIDVLSALASTGSIYVTEDNGVTVQNVAVTVQDVVADATLSAVTDVAQSDLTTGQNGNIVLVATLGDITLNDGTAPAGGNAVLAHGSGSVRLEAAAGSITANADVRSTTGHLTLRAAQNITLNANVDLVTGTPGTASLDAVAGTLTMAGTATVVATGSSVRLRAQGDITVGNLTAANVSIDSDAASIFNALGSTKNVTATNLRLQAKGQVAAYHRHLTTNIDNLTAVVENGAIFVTEDNGVTVGDVAVTVTNFNGDATTTAVTDATQSDLRSSAANGDIVLLANLGNITLNDGTAPGDGNAIFTSTAGNIVVFANAGSIIANADARSATGNFSFRAAQNISLNTGVDFVTAAGGTVLLNAVAGALTMHGTATVVAAGSSLRLRAQGDITVGNVTATNVSIDSDAGSILNAALSTKNVTATNLRLQAQNSIGASTRHFTTNIDTVSALASTGSIFVTEDNTATVANVSVTVTQINPDPTFFAVTDAAQSDFTTGQNGDIVLIVTTGNLTLNDGTAPAGGNAVLAHGSGNVRLEAVAGSLIANADVRSSFGHLTLRAGQNLTLNSGVDVVTAALGTVSLNAVAGTLTMHGTATVVATGSSARLRAQGDVTVGNITADNVSLDSDAGALVNAAGSTKNVTATRLRLQAETSIGVPTRHLTTSVDLLSARAATGSIYVTEDNGLTIDGVTVTVLEIGSDGIPVAQLDDLQSDVTTGQNGNIVLVVTTGNLTLNDASAPADGNALVAHGTGSVRLEAVTGSIAANADVRSATGHLALLAGSGLTLDAGVDIVTAAPGTVSLNAGTGALTMHGTATVLATGSSARLRAQGNVTLGKITAANVSLDSDAANIFRAALSGQNVVATNLRLQAQQSVGRPNDHLDLEVGIVTALATTGGIFLTEKDGLTVSNVAVTVTQLNADATTTAVNDAAQSDLVSGVFGHLVLVSTAGDLVLEDGSDADGVVVSAGGAGNVLLQAVAGDVIVRTGSDILAGTGNITLKAGRAMTFAAGADVTTAGAGHLYAQASGGSLTQHDDSRFTSANGNVQLWGRDDVTLGGVTTAASVSLIAGTGSVIDAGDTFGGVDIIASALRVSAAVGFGSAPAPIESTVGTVAARAGSGGFHLRETDALILGAVDVGIQQVGTDGELGFAFFALGTTGVQTTGGDGPIDIRTTSGSITVSHDSSTHGSGSLNLVAGGAAGDIVLGAVVSSTTGALNLTAGARIRETTTTETPVLVTGGVLSLSAVTGLGETGRGDLDVSAPSLNFINSGAGQAYIKSHRADAILTSATLGGAGSLIFTQTTGGLSITGPVSIADGNATFRVPGAITLTGADLDASGSLTLAAGSVAATGSDLTAGDTLRISARTTASFDATSVLTGEQVIVGTGGSLTVAQVNAGSLLDLQVGGDLATSSATTSLVATGQMRLGVTGDAGTAALPLRVRAGSLDLQVQGDLHLVNLNGLNLGRAGMTLDTDEGQTQSIAVEGGPLGTVGGQIIDRGEGTLAISSTGSLTLAAQVVSLGGDLKLTAAALVDGTPDENFLLSAANGRVTLDTTTSVGTSGAGDIDFTASEITATAQDGDLHLGAIGSTTVAGSGLAITSPASSGVIVLAQESGNLLVSAPVTNPGSGAVNLSAPAGTFTVSNGVTLSVASGTMTLSSLGDFNLRGTAALRSTSTGSIAVNSGAALLMELGSTVTTSIGAITFGSTGLMTLHRLTSSTGLVSLTSQDSITTVQLLSFANVSSETRPEVSLVNYVNILIDSDTVLATGPINSFEIARGSSDEIDLSIYSLFLTGNETL